MLKIVLLAKLTPPGGNSTTARRIRSCLVEYGGHICQLQDTTKLKDVKSFRNYLDQENIQCIIGVHLFRAGQFLIDCHLPFVIVLGGTDVNEHYKENNKFKVMTKVVQQASKLVAFSDAMACQAKQLWPGVVEQKIIIQQQAVCTTPSRFSERNMINRMKEFSSSEDKLTLENLVEGTMVLFLLIAGLRPVKDPMFVFQVMSEWHKENDKVFLVVIGADIDPDFSKQVKKAAADYPGVIVVPYLEQGDLHAVIKNCATAVVNTSVSEGMALSILEAMDLETVILARNNPGNASLIRHNYNGLLFTSPKEFLSLAKQLVQLENKESCSQLTSRAKQLIVEHHSIDAEIKTYCSILQEIQQKDIVVDIAAGNLKF